MEDTDCWTVAGYTCLPEHEGWKGMWATDHACLEH